MTHKEFSKKGGKATTLPKKLAAQKNVAMARAALAKKRRLNTLKDSGTKSALDCRTNAGNGKHPKS